MPKDKNYKTLDSGLRNDLHDGYEDGFEPLESIDVNKINDFDEMLKAMAKTSFGGRLVGEAADVMYDMFTDKSCFKVLTLSGAMTAAKMSLVICEMLDRGYIDAIVSTGALISHGFIESMGLTHFKFKTTWTPEEDTNLYYQGYNRIYDTLELQMNLDTSFDIIESTILNSFKRDEVLSSYKITNALGKTLADKYEGRGILKSAYLKKVPVFIPAFTDSELGTDLGILNRVLVGKGEKPYAFNPFIDLEMYTDIISKHETLGIFTIGGGVPRNWAQQVGPYLEVIASRVGDVELFRRFKYGVRICPEPVAWGGLSGCTYSEGITWGKFVPPEDGGRLAEVLEDATAVWPLLLKGVIQRIEKNSKK